MSSSGCMASDATSCGACDWLASVHDPAALTGTAADLHCEEADRDLLVEEGQLFWQYSASCRSYLPSTSICLFLSAPGLQGLTDTMIMSVTHDTITTTIDHYPILHVGEWWDKEV